MWKTLLWVAAFLVGIPALGFAWMMFTVLFEERDSIYTGRIYRAESDIKAIETGIGLYTGKYGHYPRELADLVPPTDHGPNEGFLRRVPSSPWNTPYHLTIEHSANGDKLKLWIAPDQKTQERTGLTEFSNETDWKFVPRH
jgi:hypothetical protein